MALSHHSKFLVWAPSVRPTSVGFSQFVCHPIPYIHQTRAINTTMELCFSFNHLVNSSDAMDALFQSLPFCAPHYPHSVISNAYVFKFSNSLDALLPDANTTLPRVPILTVAMSCWALPDRNDLFLLFFRVTFLSFIACLCTLSTA